MSLGEADTQDYLPPSSQRPLPPEPVSSLVQVDVAGMSHPGNVRPNNEDHFLVVHFGRYLEARATNLPSEQVPPRVEDDGYGMVVADGMGGRAAGEEASRLAITTLLNLVLTTPDWILLADDPSRAEEIMRRAVERFGKIDRALASEAQDKPRLHGFGTTMTLAANVGRNLLIAHIGDSRAYLFRNRKLYQLTRDHTVVRELCDAGLITPAQAATHHFRHVLTKNLGGDRAEQPDVQTLTLETGDCLLLCSDGLSEMVTDDELRADLALDVVSQVKCEKLIDRALAAGGKDNVTVVVGQYR